LSKGWSRNVPLRSTPRRLSFFISKQINYLF